MRRVPLVSAILVAALAAPAGASAAFKYGVASAEVTPTSAVVWAHATKAGKVKLQLALDKRLERKRITKTAFAKKNDDMSVWTRVAGLIPDTRYWFRFSQSKARSVIGTFKTAPRPRAAKTIRFAVTGDSDPIRVNGHNYWNKDGSADMATYKAMTREQNDFNVNLGDTIYSDSVPPGSNEPFALNLALKRKKYQDVLTYPNLLELRQSGPVYNQWDDHEFVDDFTPSSEGCDVGSIFTPQYACDVKGIHSSGVKAFREYMPVTYSPRNGTYRSFRWGKSLEIFILDERSFRSIKASEVKQNPGAPEPTAHVCENQGNEDVAPRIPQRIRNLFALVVPSLGNPTPPACLAALEDPNRTMLGKRQYDLFTAAIKRSPATWKVIVNEVPMMEMGINPYDDWEGYEAERERLLTFLKDNVKNVAIVTTDFHSNWVNDARIKTYPEQGGPVPSGIREFVAGGVADQLFGREVDAVTGQKDSWKLADDAFLKRPPPDGPGMECSNMVTFGYVQLEASAKSLKVVLKDNKGRQMKNATDDKPCGPYVMAAR
jgi:phosphodiesterase/alkaline phosphatase D-like protein